VHGGARRPIGAPSKLTPEIAELIATHIEAGVTYEVAAAAVGISRDSLYTWREKGAIDIEAGRETAYAGLVDKLRRALAVAEVALVTKISADPDWRAAAHILSVRYPERWAKRTSVDVESSERAAPRTVEPVEERRDAILAILAQATAAPAGAP
jgi:hypothetical protein